MDKATLLRTRTGTQGTFGVLSLEDFECCSLELPWEQNKNSVSCVPTGVYFAEFIHSTHYGPCYWLHDVPGRSEILIHTGNFAGDESEGYETHSAGCILVGKRFGRFGGQNAVLLSRKTLRKFVDKVMQRENFSLEIKEMF